MSDTQTALTTRTDAILHDLTSVYDVPVHITIDVGRLRLRVRDLLRLAPDSIIALDFIGLLQETMSSNDSPMLGLVPLWMKIESENGCTT